jgi:hypothetical protein
MLILRKLLLSLVVSGLCSASLEAAVLTGVDPTIINIGTGPDLSYLVIDESTLYSTPLEFIYHYTYDSNTPITGEQLMQAITNTISSGLGMTTTAYAFGDSLDALSYSGTTVAGTNAPDYSSGTYWSYYVAGGDQPGSTNITPTNTWAYADVGFSTRTIAPGSWDGETLSGWGTDTSGGPPSVAISAVPEPATLPLILLSLATVVAVIRWKSSERNLTL